MLQDHGKPPYQQRQDGALPAQAPGQDFLCQSDAEEVDRAAHAAAAQVRGPHSTRPRSCAERMPAVPALHDCCLPCICTTRLAVTVHPTSRSCLPAVVGPSPPSSLLDLSWGHSLDIAQKPPGCKTDALAAVPLCLWLCALPHLQHLTLKQVSAPQRPKPCPLDLGASGPAHMRHDDTDATRCWQGLPHASLSVQFSSSAFQNTFLPLLQELVSFPITLDDEVSEAGSDLEADDATLPDQQPAAQTGLKERRHVFSNELAPGDMAAEQVRQLPLLNCQLPAASPHLR